MKRVRPLATTALAMALLLPSSVSAAESAARAATVIRNPGSPSYAVSLRGDALGHRWRGTESVTFTNLEAEPLTTIWLRLWSNGVRGCGAHAITVTAVEGGVAGDLSRRCTALPVDLDAPLAQGDRGDHLDAGDDRPAQTERSLRVSRGTRARGDGAADARGARRPGLAPRPLRRSGRELLLGRRRLRGDAQRPERAADADHRCRGRVADSGRPADHDLCGPGRPRLRVGGGQVAGDPRDLRRDGRRRLVPPPTTSAAEPRRRPSGMRSARSTRSPQSFGTFPYPEMDVVLTSFAAFGGMEYPTIIFTNPSKITIAHELAHQYWYGIVGDDQYSAAVARRVVRDVDVLSAVRRMEEVRELPLALDRGPDHERHGLLGVASVRVRHDLRRRRLPARQPRPTCSASSGSSRSCTTTPRIIGWA